MGKKFDAGFDEGFDLAIGQFNTLESEYFELRQELVDLQRRYDLTVQRDHESLAQMRTWRNNCAEEITALEETLDVLRSELHRATAQGSSYKADRDKYKTQVDNQRAELARLNGLVADPEAPVREKLRRQIEDREDLERLLGEKSRRIAELEETVAGWLVRDSEKQRRISEMEEQVEELDTDVSDLEAAIEAERRDREKARADARQRIAELERLNESQGVTIDTYCNRIEELEADLEDACDELAERRGAGFETQIQSTLGPVFDALNRSFR
jgi:chromosome segregation ATPase